jgi:hypothetical protein
MRGAGYITPLLDGIDEKAPVGAEVYRHILRVGGIDIIPLNSSGYAQVRIDVGVDEATWTEVMLRAETAGGSEARRALEKLRIVDAARISEGHLEAVRHLLEAAAPSATKRVGTDGRLATRQLRIAVLHHQLLPVSTEEEVKSFESFTNLGLLRQFLRANDIAIVLHGHKHTPHTYVDYVWSYSGDADESPRQIRVIAGPSPSGRSLDQMDVCRLLDIDAAAGVIRMESVPAVIAGQGSSAGKVATLTFAEPGAATVARTDGVSIIDGVMIADVYARLLPTVNELGSQGELHNVLCRIAESPTDDEMAILYPAFRPRAPEEHFGDDGEDDSAPEAQLEHFKELVRWWQDAQFVSAGDEPAFTHGSRILRYEGHLDQLAAVVKAIMSKPDTSRAVMVLLQPTVDRIDTPTNAFPSFCFIQFLIRRGEAATDKPRLDCIGYFRKQEVRYWWLVNVAELASLQRRIVDELKRLAKGENGWLSRTVPGSVTTMAARAHAGQSAPKVQVPKIDQYYAISRERLVNMAHAVVWEQMPERAEIGSEWLRLMLDLIPSTPREPDGVAVALPGLRYLLDQVQQHIPKGSRSQPDRLVALATSLEALWKENQQYASDQHSDQVTDVRYSSWRNAVIGHIKRIIELTVTHMRSGAVGNAEGGGAQTLMALKAVSAPGVLKRKRPAAVRSADATGNQELAKDGVRPGRKKSLAHPTKKHSNRPSMRKRMGDGDE